MNKIDVRTNMKKKRQDIKSDFIINASITIANKFMNEFGHLNSFAIYCEIDNEVRTSELIKTLILNKKSVYLPVYRKDFIGFGLCNNLDKVVTKKNGFREPVEISQLTDVDVMIVPALAFDKEGFRIGYGAGFYDRVLKKIKTKYRVGFAYEFQIIDKIPSDYYDEPVDVVITEKNTYRRS